MRNLILIFSLLMTALSASADPLEQVLESRGRNQTHMMIPDLRMTGGWFEQKLDHFTPSDTRTFRQRYFYSQLFASGGSSSAANLVYVCGETSCDQNVAGTVISLHAQNLKMNYFVFEHRYYGQSQPFADLSTEHLAYLTTEQALADLVALKIEMQKKLGLSGKWILMGGSYAGSLAAYARARYPDHFAGALSSSAPVKAENNLEKYDQLVGRLAGPACVQGINKALGQIEAKIASDEGFNELRARFGAESLLRRDDFLFLLSAYASGAIQYGDRAGFCQLVIDKGLDGYVEAHTAVDKMYGKGAFFPFMPQASEDITLAKYTRGAGTRQWFYQTCTEYGFWQTSSSDINLRTRSAQLSEKYYLEVCRRLFGINKLADTASFSKEFYEPLLNATTSKILFTTGDRDPWLSLMIAPVNGNTSNSNTIAHFIQDAGHCEDLRRNGSETVSKAQRQFAELITKW